ncbi:hypothetical protein PR202_ga28085 [Eleusine coracana subsp. coracana]|uniref:DUF6598 domain-containing protein n=1 Tax=Eleusine coracana subsp. coracana TaxID=191504 RepID=A0AAV5DIN1_ELECO|nr:hypothetical protein PR202_ga28085 [Eleusine coracana subsp. coracana]
MKNFSLFDLFQLFLHVGTCPPFTVDEFPRLSSDHFVQTDTIYARKDLHRRGPSPLSLFRPFNDPVITRKSNHWFGDEYQLSDESEIRVNNAGTFECSSNCICHPLELLQFIDLKIAGYHHAQPGRAKIFGFFAVRDKIEPLRNYVYNREIDNYEAVSVKPKTVICFQCLTVYPHAYLSL